MNVIRGEESMNQITNIDENTDGHTDGDFEMDQMHNAWNNEEWSRNTTPKDTMPT